LLLILLEMQITSSNVFVDSVAEQLQVNHLLECIRRAQKGKHKEMNPEDFIPLDFTPPAVSNKSDKKNVIVLDSDETDNSPKKKNAKGKKQKKRGRSVSRTSDEDEPKRKKERQQKRGRSVSRSSNNKSKKKKKQKKRGRSVSRSSNEDDKSDIKGTKKYHHLADLDKDLRASLRVSNLFVSFHSSIHMFTNWHK
jgi:hypothetical protein